MGTYKVIQDIEAEDKLIGWMTPRQTIYAAIVVVSGFIGFMLATKGVWWLALFLLPHMILFAVLAGPFVHDQPSEVWLLAKIQFFLKPRRRIWDQSGLKELVTITVPKKIERQLTDGLSQREVKSRLHALANTIDSRGWAVKNINVNLYAEPSYATVGLQTDRLLDTAALPQEVPNYDVTAQDDMLDEDNNPTAQHLQQMIEQSSQTHRQQAVAKMQQTTTTPSQQPADYWFLNASSGQQAPVQDGFATFDHTQTVAPGSNDPVQPVIAGPSDDDQAALLNRVKASKKKHVPGSDHLHRIRPLSEQPPVQAPAAPARPKAAPNNPAIMQLANNDDLNVATIARQANKASQGDDGEVVISLR